MDDADLDDDLALNGEELEDEDEFELDDESSEEKKYESALNDEDELHVSNMLGLDPEEDEIDDFLRRKEAKRELGGIETFMGKTLLNHRMLTREEEVIAAKLVEVGDPRGIEILVKFNQRLVRKIAQRYLGTGMSIEDLVMEGNLGLIRAAELFKADYGWRFSTYAVNWIRQGVQRALANQNSMVRVPVHAQNVRIRIIRALRKIEAEQGSATPERVFERIKIDDPDFKVTFESVNVIMRDFLYLGNNSLNDLLGEESDSSELMSLVSSEKDDLNENSISEGLVAEELKVHMLRALTEREFEVVCNRFGLFGRAQATLEEVGAVFSLTRERIRQIEVNALRKLRIKMRSLGIDYGNFYDLLTERASSGQRLL